MLKLSLLRAFFRRKLNEVFCHENISNLTHNFCKAILIEQNLQNFLLKIIIKNSYVKFNAFSKRNGSFIFLSKGCG